MVHNLFSPPTSRLPLEDVLELVDKYLDNARKERNPSRALQLCSDAKSQIKVAEKIFSIKRVDDSAQNIGIANAYHEHGKLLDELGNHDKAQKSHNKAEKWGYIRAAGQQTRPGNVNNNIHRSLFPPAALPATPDVVGIIHQGIPQSDGTRPCHPSNNPPELNYRTPTQIEDFSQIPQNIFHHNVAPPITRYTLPEAGERITSTLQLAYCLSLLRPSLVSIERLSESENEWLLSKNNDPDELRRLQSMATDLIKAFIRDELKKPNVVTEVVSLTAVLDQDDFRKLLQAFIDGIDQSFLLEIHLLDGLAELIRNAGQGYLDTNDLVRILELLSTRLKTTHKQSTQHIRRLALTISNVLDSMVDIQVEGLSREDLHEPLSEYLKQLQENSDTYLVYQAAYAYQALQYIPDDETTLQAMLRRTGNVVQGMFGTVSAVKGLDLNGFIEGLQSVQKGLAGASEAVVLVKNTYANAKILAKEDKYGFLESLKEGFSFARKSAWYPALRGLDILIQEGQFVAFEQLIREAPCCQDLAFQWGACQRLGEIAINTVWDDGTRHCAVTFLGELYNNNATCDQQTDVNQWILDILNRLSGSPKGALASHAQTLLRGLGTRGDNEKCSLYQNHESDNPGLYPLMVNLATQEYPLLDRVQNKPDVETPLRQLRRERLKDRGGDVYISPRAKFNPRATEEFDLTSKVQEFLDSDRKVFLLLGDSGAGKSTFNRALEISLWDKYNKTEGRIPLFIHLPAIKEPEQDLVAKQLRKYDFTESQIRELKTHHEFILICDGYDESQQTRNLYMSNQFNQAGGWRARMLISCRTEYNGIEYRDCFQPTERNNGGKSELFQEAIITPFNKDQIQDYVGRYFVTAIYDNQSGNPVVSYLEHRDRKTWKESLFNKEDGRHLLREAIPLTRNGDQYRFIHKSLLEYGLALVVFDPSEYQDETEPTLPTSRRGSASSVLSFETPIPIEKSAIVHERPLLDSPLGRRNLVGEPSVLLFLAERIQQEPMFKDLLRSVIERSKTDKMARIAAANAITILIRAGVQFNGADLRGVQIPGADLSYGAFDSAQLEGADLRKVNFRSAWLRQANLSGSLMTGVQFGELPSQHEDSPVNSCTYSPDGKTCAVGTANGDIIVYRTSSMEKTQTLRGHVKNVREIAFSPTGDLIVSGGRDTTVRLWDVSTGDCINVFQGHGNVVTGVAYSPKGNQIASSSRDLTVRLWDVDTGECVHTLLGHSDKVYSVAYSPKRDHLASGSRDTTVRLWDINTGACVLVLQGHSACINSVVYSPSGDQLASASKDMAIRLWNANTGDCINTLLGHTHHVISVAYSPKGDRIASGSLDKAVRLWDVDTGDCIDTLLGHSNVVISVAYSPKGDQIASGSVDKTMRLWDANTSDSARALQSHGDKIHCIVYSPKRNQIASGCKDMAVRLWDVNTGDCVSTLLGHTHHVISVAYSPKGDLVASGSRDMTVRLWNVDAGECVHTLQGHSDSVSFVVFSPKGDRVASGGHDVIVRLWDVETGDCIHTLQGHVDRVLTAAYSPKGNQIASGSFDNLVRLWSLDTGDCVHTLQGHSKCVKSITYSPNGDRFVSGSDDKTVRVWDADTGNCVHTFLGHTGSITTVVYSPKGDQIASGSWDQTVRLWDVDSGSCIHTLQGHELPIYCVAYSSKGDQIASGSWD
ncbi:hypothetical protein BGZ80_002701, partial [Entomortierella chlamydospora]